MNKKIDYWENMPRSNAEELMAADAFYDEEIFPLTAADFVQKNFAAENLYDSMFLTLGTSWQPLALSIMLHKPKRVIFLGTQDVQHEISQIKQAVHDEDVEYCFYEVDKGQSIRLLDVVERLTAELRQKGYICFDITGGTKAMVAAAAMIAYKLKIDVFYIEGTFMPVYRRPKPGSEMLIKLIQPN